MKCVWFLVLGKARKEFIIVGNERGSGIERRRGGGGRNILYQGVNGYEEKTSLKAFFTPRAIKVA